MAAIGSAGSGRRLRLVIAILMASVGLYACGGSAAADNGPSSGSRPIGGGPEPAASVAPSTPSGLVANVVSASRIDLNWPAATDNTAVTGYRDYRNGVCLIALGNAATYIFKDIP